MALRIVAREEVLQLFLNGRTPGEIAAERGTAISDTIRTLEQLIGQGLLRRSDVLFTVPAERREIVRRELLLTSSRDQRAIQRKLLAEGHDVPLSEVYTVVAFHSIDAAYGDMYEDVRTIEVELHWLLRRLLEEEYGDGELGWWRKGIPETVRTELARRREADDDPAPEPYCYTDLMHLIAIIEKNWNLVSQRLPKHARDKRQLKADLVRLNRIRNQVMHPVRGLEPREEDFEFVRDLRLRLGFRADLLASGRPVTVALEPTP